LKSVIDAVLPVTMQYFLYLLFESPKDVAFPISVSYAAARFNLKIKLRTLLVYGLMAG
jgi:hypothetical protein